MDLSKISIKLRPRNGYAALDVGTRMVQQHWRQLYTFSILTSLPLFLILMVWMPINPLWIAFIIWWLKPLWERPLLLILSQEVFHNSLTFKEVWQAIPKLISKQLIQSLTLRRFSPTRSFDAPVMQLENLSGSARRARLYALHSKSPGSISMLTLVLVHVEAFILLGTMTFVVFFLPENSVDFDYVYQSFIEDTGVSPLQILYAIAWYIAMVVIAPFYVAGGFCSYLNQRSLLEAWDLELIFKQLAKKHQPKKFRYDGIIVSILFFLIMLSPSLPIDAAESVDAFEQEKIRTKQQINNILHSSDFKRIQMEVEFLPHKEYQQEQEKEEDISKEDLNPSGIKALGEVLAWSVIILVVLYLLFKLPTIIEYLSNTFSTKEATIESKIIPDTLFGLDLKQESLPDDVAQEALQLWNENHHREALGLLFRASLSKLIHDYNCPFEDGYTELECYKVVEHQRPHLADYFLTLTTSWRQLAYGHQIPQQEAFIYLVEHWAVTFANEASPEGAADE